MPIPGQMVLGKGSQSARLGRALASIQDTASWPSPQGTLGTRGPDHSVMATSGPDPHLSTAHWGLQSSLRALPHLVLITTPGGSERAGWAQAKELSICPVFCCDASTLGQPSGLPHKMGRTQGRRCKS